MVLYHYDFVGDTADLNAKGQQKLARIAEWLPKTFDSVIIEDIPNHPELARTRQQVVLTRLQSSAFPISDERVVVGTPISNGLGPNESRIIRQNLINQTSRRGVTTSTSAATYSGSGYTSGGGSQSGGSAIGSSTQN